MINKRKEIILEYPMNCTIQSLYAKISTDSGLGCWFADDVKIDDNKFVFSWRKASQIATRISYKENKFVRFQWNDDNDTEYFFELAIESYELTNGVSLVITDFVEYSDVDDAKQMWDNQVKQLKRELGV